MEKISDRLRFAIENLIDSKGRTQTLEDITEISSETWRKFLNGKQRATLGMLEALTTRWPEYAFWISTGINDSDFGHRSPKGTGFPKESKEQPSSASYLKAVVTDSIEKDADTKEFWNDTSLEKRLDIHDLTLRNLHHLNHEQSKGDSAPKINALRKIRWVEILIDVYLPSLNYEDTETMLKIAQTVLSEAKSLIGEEITPDLEIVYSKIRDLNSQIAKHHSWKAKVLSDTNESSN